MHIQFMKLHPDAKCPTKNNPGEAAFDFCSIEDYTLAPRERRLFKTGIAHALPEWYYGRIAGRSGLAYKYGIDVLAGVIDETYRGDIGVVMLNTGTEPLEIKKGDRIAQYIIEKYYEAEWVEVETLPDSIRGTGWFGSSGR